MPSKLRILVLSDLHAYSNMQRRLKQAPSYFKVGADMASISSPTTEFFDVVNRDAIEADYVVCCGDLAHQADPRGIEEARRFLKKVKQAVGARELLVTTGNHDLDSRFKYDAVNPQDFLKQLRPRFPHGTGKYWDRFWARNLFFREVQPVRFLILNTAASHGYRKREASHGLISEQMLMEVTGNLRPPWRPSINICICHHHPHRHPEIDSQEYDEIVNGQRFLDLLSEPGVAPWLVLHGHKHHPRIAYAQGGSRSPVVFAAGSFSACLYDELKTAARNQFYLITFDESVLKGLGEGLGSFKSWTWYEGTGWIPAEETAGLPAEGGFGYRDIEGLGSRIRRYRTDRILNWSEVMRLFPEVKYLLPQDLKHLVYFLKHNGYSVTDGYPFPAEIMRVG